MRNENYTDYLQVLGVNHSSSWSDIKTAYQRAARQWHPDRHIKEPEKQKLAEEQFKVINQAYSKLSSYYQRHGRLPEDPLQAQSPSPATESHGNEVHRQAAASSSAHQQMSEEKRMLQYVIFRRSALVLLSIILSVALFNLFLSTSGSHHASATNSPVTARNSPWKNDLQPKNDPLKTNHPGSRAALEESEQRYPKSLTYGASFGETQNILGIPTRVEGNTWFYGESEIHFKDGVVVDWLVSDSDPLNVTLAQKTVPAPLKTHFSTGDTKSEVLHIQGPPIWKTDSVWQYKMSKIFFSGGRVTSWYSSPLDPLKVRKH